MFAIYSSNRRPEELRSRFFRLLRRAVFRDSNVLRRTNICFKLHAQLRCYIFARCVKYYTVFGLVPKLADKTRVARAARGRRSRTFGISLARNFASYRASLPARGIKTRVTDSNFESITRLNVKLTSSRKQ